MLEVHRYNKLRAPAVEAMANLKYRFEKWCEYQLERIKAMPEENDRVNALAKFDADRAKRETELRAVWTLIDSGEEIMQTCINDHATNHDAAYQRGVRKGFENGRSQIPNRYANPEAFRANHLVNVMQAHPKLY